MTQSGTGWRSGVVAACLAAFLSSTTSAPCAGAPAADEPAASPGAAPGDSSEARSLEDRIAALEEALKALRAERGSGPGVAEMQRRLDLLAAELEKIRMGAAAAERPLESVHGLGPAASRVYGVAKGVSIGGYGEALFEDYASESDGGAPSGRTDRFDFLRGVLYFGYKFSDRIVFNSEIEYEHASTGKGGEVAIEFAYLDFLLGKHANIRAGMVLVPAGFINELHEPPVFLGARRPDVERRILPATWRENGAGIFGDAGPFAYRAFLLAGFDSRGFSAADAVRGGRQSGAQSKAEDFAFAARVDYTGVPGLLVGGFFYRGGTDQGALAPVGFSVDPNGAAVTPPAEPFDGTVTLYDLHAEYRARGLELRALHASGHLDDAKQVNDARGLDGSDSVGEKFRGWYAQAGFDLMSLRGGTSGQAVIPYVRYEAFNTQDEVPGEAPQDLDARTGPAFDPVPFSANPANDVRIWTYGVAYKPIYNVAIKLDHQDHRNEAQSGVDQFALAISYLF